MYPYYAEGEGYNVISYWDKDYKSISNTILIKISYHWPGNTSLALNMKFNVRN